jgi:type 1 glutamine amidotransferase
MKLLLLVLGFLLAASSGASSQVPLKTRPVHVLFLVGGVFHDFDVAPATTAETVRKKLESKVTMDFLITKDLEMLRPERIRAFDLLMLDVCQVAELSPEQKKGLLQAVRHGLPVVAFHCTLFSYPSWPEFRKMIGAYVPGHAKRGPMCVNVTRPGEAITAGLPAQFEIADEPFMVDDRDPTDRAYMETCKVYKEEQPVTVKAPDGETIHARMSMDTGPDRKGVEPLVWTKTYGKGRVFAMAFGHDLESQQNPNFLQLLQNGILWVLGLSQ